VLQREQAQVATQLAGLRSFIATHSASASPAPAGMISTTHDQAVTRANSGDTNSVCDKPDISPSELQATRDELRSRLTALDVQLTNTRARLDAQHGRPEERMLLETQLVVLQDTRRLLSEEAEGVAARLTAARTAELAADGAAADGVALAELARLTEQLAATEARLDAAKLARYFPRAQGFRQGCSLCMRAHDVHSNIAGVVSVLRCACCACCACCPSHSIPIHRCALCGCCFAITLRSCAHYCGHTHTGSAQEAAGCLSHVVTSMCRRSALPLIFS
jgi:hypothetical protein